MATQMALRWGAGVTIPGYSHPAWMDCKECADPEAYEAIPALYAAILRHMRSGATDIRAQQSNAYGGREYCGKMFGVERHGRSWRFFVEAP